jgi:hypothetical protein
MIRRIAKVFLTVAAVLVFVPVATAQEGQIAGTVRDGQNAVMPGVTVEVTSPALIEKLRTTTTDSNGQYRITNLPVGTYKVTFSLEGFTRHERDDIEVTSNFTAPVNATMNVGQVSETVLVLGMTPIVDVQNSREVINWPGDQIRNMPTSRNVNSLLQLTAGIGSQYTTSTSQTPFGAPGVCVGGVGVFCSPNINGFNLGDTGTAVDQTNMAQGRVLVDGQVVNAGGTVPIFGQTGGYVSDIANAQEVNVRVSGALGESETGGSEINIVPRTGGNRFAGDFFLSYTTEKWFDTNNGNYPDLPAAFQPVKDDHDVTLAYGGPVKRDKLWFYAAARDQFIRKLPVGVDFWPNLWEGIYGYNYQPNRDQPRVEYTNHWRNASVRVTWQASQKNKFNFFWDEQDSCQDPCTGVVSVSTSPESWFSPQVQPNRVQQVTWTNPLTSKILLEAGLNVTTQLYKTDSHIDFTDYVDIPRISETCSTGACSAGGDATSPRVNVFAGGAIFPLTSGSLNNEVGGLSERRDLANYRTRASLSYVSGGHHAKFGYDGGHYSQDQINRVNNLQQTWNYVSPPVTANCAVGQCGNTSLQFPSDPLNSTRRPVPTTIDYNTGSTTLVDHVRYSALYAQDLWTLKRVTVGAALRYDHATSGYGESCFGPNQFVLSQFCVPPSDGVSYNDLSPRWSVGWDVRGNGRTAIKWNMGKYNNAAGISGLYSATNPARRTVNLLRRNWTDSNGNRRVDCDLMNFSPNGECAGFVPFFFGAGGLVISNDTARFGRDPLGLDAAGNPVGLQSTQCGRTEQGIPAAVQAYCDQYGESLIDGWGRRRGEWQFDLGIQHEVLPRLSAEVVYHRRDYSNLTLTDQIGVGCDRFNGTQTQAACNDALLNYTSQSYDFFSVVAPADPRLPGGGGYRILGLYDSKPTLVQGQPSAQTFWDARNFTWNSVDVNFNYRGPQGIFLQAGTSTDRTNRDSCDSQLDPPSVRGRDDAPYQAGCLSLEPWRTTIRGSVTYVVPKVDILVSTVFQSLPGSEQTGQLTFSKDQVTWGTPSRAALPCPPPPPGVPSAGVGCFIAAQGGTLAPATSTTVPVQLLLSNEMFGERVTTFDLKLAKNIRFSGRRLNVGVDVYNVFNSDAITSYRSEFTDNAATTTVEHWLDPMGLVSPRFLRLQVQFNF